MQNAIQEMDILNQRTTNINVRISPMLKVKIIEQGAKMGVNLSDFINYVLTKQMTGEMDVENTPQYKELKEYSLAMSSVNEAYNEQLSKLEKENEALKKQLHATKAELSKFQTITEPYKQLVGRDVPINGKTHRFEHVADVLANLLSNFKIKN